MYRWLHSRHAGRPQLSDAVPGQVAVVDTFAANSSATGNSDMADGHNMRTMLLSGDYFLGSVIAVTLAKLVLRLRTLGVLAPPAANRVAAEAMLVKLQRHSSKQKQELVDGHIDVQLPGCSIPVYPVPQRPLECRIAEQALGAIADICVQLLMEASRHLPSDRTKDNRQCKNHQGSCQRRSRGVVCRDSDVTP